MDQSEFNHLIGACAELGELFPEGLVFIGGIAVYLHTIHVESTQHFAEFTHDADFYISLADMADLRDIEEVTANRRLSKHQMIKKGFEFDIYTERNSSLVVPFDAVYAHAVKFGSLRAASLEHLFVLKLEAFLDRRQSVKGDKDAKDLFRIAAVAAASKQGFRGDICAPYLRDEHLPLLSLVYKSPASVAMAQGNAVIAKKLRRSFEQAMKVCVQRYAKG